MGGSGYITTGGSEIPGWTAQLCIPAAGQTFADCTNNNLGQHIPVGVADTTTFSEANGFDADADYYVIALVQHREQMSSSLPATGTLLREYVQLETPANAAFSKHVALQNELFDGATTPALMPDGSQAYAVDDPHFLGPVIVAAKDKPVRIVFYNLLPKGTDGNLFLPGRLHHDGLWYGPHGHGGPDGSGYRHGYGAQPHVHRESDRIPTASRTTVPPCTCMAAPPPGSAMELPTSGLLLRVRILPGHRV